MEHGFSWLWKYMILGKGTRWCQKSIASPPYYFLAFCSTGARPSRPKRLVGGGEATFVDTSEYANGERKRKLGACVHEL